MDTGSNLELLGVVAKALGDLCDRVVVVGGAAVNLLVSDAGAPEIRSTEDIDVVVELASKRDFRKFEKELRERGFVQDESPGAPLCRWIIGGVPVDFLPTDPKILGFSNRWYPEAIEAAKEVVVEGVDRPIQHVDAACFLATKFEAFRGRGKGDYRSSHDVEDIIVVIDGRAQIVEDVGAASKPVMTFVAKSVDELMSRDDASDLISGHLPPDEASQGRLSIVLARLEGIRSFERRGTSSSDDH